MDAEAIPVRQHALHVSSAWQAPCSVAGENINAAPDDDGVSVWNHVIRALRCGYRSDGAGVAYLTRPASRRAAYALSSHIQVEVVERLSDTSIAVLWQDATHCRYADQVWISCRARRRGRCALSGAIIRRDDMIYKPRVRTVTPVNVTAMILASVIEQMAAMTVAGA